MKCKLYLVKASCQNHFAGVRNKDLPSLWRNRVIISCVIFAGVGNKESAQFMAQSCHHILCDGWLVGVYMILSVSALTSLTKDSNLTKNN